MEICGSDELRYFKGAWERDKRGNNDRRRDDVYYSFTKPFIIMKHYFISLLILLLPTVMTAQQNYPDSLKQALHNAITDSAKYSIAFALSLYYGEDKIDSSLVYINQGLMIARKNNRKINEASLLTQKGRAMAILHKYVESFESFQKALKIAEDPANENKTWKDDKISFHQNRLKQLGYLHLNIAFHRGYKDSKEQSVAHFRKALQLGKEVSDTVLMGYAFWGIALNYPLLHNKLDSALIFLNKAEQIFRKNGIKSYIPMVYLTTADIYWIKGDKNKSLYYIRKSLEELSGQNNTNALSWAYRDLTFHYLQEKQKDSSLYYANKNIEVLLSQGEKNMGEAYLQLSKSYELRNEIDSAYKYQGFALATQDSTSQAEIKNQSAFQQQSFKDQMKVKELEQEKASYQSKIRTNTLLGGLFTLLVVAFFLFKNNRQNRRSKRKIEIAYERLQNTQSQLIQSEKMASLGELTAGIAHEIQNPLNFVNNFSDLNKELTNELKEELAVGNTKSANEIADDIIENEEKIIHHGKRAESIVKGMLLHSRGSSGQKEPTDINALCDEYLRLSYHGFRAKDKSFNADFKLETDESLPKIEVVPQDIGRVLLNLINNAFFAVNEKAKQNIEGYKPQVIVSTSSSPFGEGEKGG